MDQGASMDSVAQFLLGCENASGKKHYHWNCNCGLHGGQCTQGSPAKVDPSKGKKYKKVKSISSARSASVTDLCGYGGVIRDKRQFSMGNLLELLDSSRSQEDIRRDAANKGSL